MFSGNATTVPDPNRNTEAQECDGKPLQAKHIGTASSTNRRIILKLESSGVPMRTPRKMRTLALAGDPAAAQVIVLMVKDLP